jgi:O-antigen ligase
MGAGTMIPNGHRDAILGLSFATWCFLLTFPMLAVVGEPGEGIGPVPLYQMIGAAGFLVVAALFGRFDDISSRYDNFQTFLITVLFLSLVLQLHDDAASILTGIVFTIAIIVTTVLLSHVSAMPAEAVARYLGLASIVLAGFGVSSVVLLGWPQDRHVGLIQPNAFGSAMLVAFVFSQFSEGILFLGVRIIGFVLAAAVSSRFAMIGCLLAFLVFEITWKPVNPKLLLLALLLPIGLLVFHDQVSSLLAFDDPSRNLDSGFTGRDERWASSLQAMESNPFGTGFKRAPVEAWGHNGYLKTFVEFGVIGGGLIIASVGCIVAGAVSDAIANSSGDERLRRLASARAAGLVALTFATFFQPQLFNLGDVHGISLALLLFWCRWPPARQPRSRLGEARTGCGPTQTPMSSPGRRTPG